MIARSRSAVKTDPSSSSVRSPRTFARRIASTPSRQALLQRAGHDHERFDVLERDDRVGGEEFGRVIDVGELVPVGVEEQREPGRELSGFGHFRPIYADFEAVANPTPRALVTSSS